MRNFLLILLFLLMVNPLHAQLFINEFMADNDNIITDNAGDYDDWLELYNDYEYAINLSGFYLTDDYDDPTQWACPNVSIPAKGYLIIWADDEGDQGELHANFKLGASGEVIGLYNGTEFVDSLTFGEQITDISFGRFPDGADAWYFMNESTPGNSNTYTVIDITEPPAFSQNPGFYTGSVVVELSVSYENATIRYTLDGSDPVAGSSAYALPIEIDETKALRARTFRTGYDPSEIKTCSYIIGDNFDIATLSVVTDPENLWDTETGIYINYEERGDEWERPASIEFFESNDNLEFSYNVGLRIHGGWTRSLEKKSFRYYFRSEYGQSWLNYQLFKAKELDEYKRFVTSAAFGNSFCRDDNGTLLRDPLHHVLGRRLEKDIGVGTHPVALYLNGQPWGLYNAIERIDDDWLETNFGITEADIIENYNEPEEGTEARFVAMIEFFENNDFDENENYETAKSMIDIQNFTRYNVMEIWGGNRDWPDNNNIAYCGYEEGDKWRWVLWDFDKSMVYYSTNSLAKAIDENTECTIILRKLLQNEEYRNYFVNEFADAFNTVLRPEVVVPVVDSLAALIRNDVWFEAERWDGDVQKWEGNVDFMRTYAENRLDYMYEYIREEFNISANRILTLANPQGGTGRVRVNSIYAKSFPWNGIYFDGIPIELEAIPDAGYQFKEWSDPSLPETPTVTLTLTENYSVHPIFEASSQAYPVVINEINYNSASEFDTDDWVELYNTSDNPVNVGNWHFRDDDDEHDFIFAEGTTIPAHGFLVLCVDQAAFSSLFPEVTDILGDVDFGLGGGGDDVRIYDNAMNLVDSVTYDDGEPWPTEPDGDGPTLELIDSDSDNTLGESWQASANHGTPGAVNSNMSGPAITDLRASAMGENILLEWSEVDGISTYNVYRGTTYNFVPDVAGGSNRIAANITDEDAGANGVQWTDTGNGADIVGDVAANYFYKVTAVSAEDSEPSNVAGEFDYELITTQGTDINTIVVLMNTENTRTPIATAEDLAHAIPYCTDVYWWDANGQGTVGHVKGIPFNDFDVFPGQPYSMSISKDTSWTIAGSYSDVSFELVTTESTDINQIGVPLAKSDLADADQLGLDIPNCTDVFLWDAEGQGTIGHVVGVPFNNFAVRAGYPYSVSINAPTVWPEYGGGAESLARYPILDGMRINSDDEFLGKNIPHTVYGKFEYPREISPDIQSPNIRAWIASRPDDILFSGSRGVGTEDNYWWVSVSDFATNWQVGDSLVVEFDQKDSELQGSVLVVLSDAGSDDAGQIQLTNVTENPNGNSGELPKEYALLQNYPNPFNPETTISFEIPKESHVKVQIYDINGRLVNTLIDGVQMAGYHQVKWNGRDKQGSAVVTGVYICRMETKVSQFSLKLLLVK